MVGLSTNHESKLWRLRVSRTINGDAGLNSIEGRELHSNSWGRSISILKA